MSPSAVVAAWELGLRLRERREHLALSVGGAARAVQMQQPNLSAVEAGKKKVTAANLTRLAQLFEFDADGQQHLQELRADADHRDWYHRYTWLFGDEFIRYLGLEYGAACVSVYQGSLVHGLLQTEDYAKAVIRGGSPYIRLTEVEPRCEVRLARQRRLTGEHPLRLTALLSEAVLRQEVGGPEVMRRQLDHLVAAAEEHEHIEIRVLPFTAGAHPALGGPFTVLSFDSPGLPNIVWQETLTTLTIIERHQQVREYTVALAESMQSALSADESRDLIREVAKEIT
ncbi:Scr1 family TA system antitoxin-like transcriptional regulator [Actinokineospora sp.]|uniref:Scr1 family TA system antitoxin-like transcriptional regulator n=1 Tax=Actinokineospora sp. TaxID=1872133 RepID=UPI00403796F3